MSVAHAAVLKRQILKSGILLKGILKLVEAALGYPLDVYVKFSYVGVQGQHVKQLIGKERVRRPGHVEHFYQLACLYAFYHFSDGIDALTLEVDEQVKLDVIIEQELLLILHARQLREDVDLPREPNLNVID